MPVFTVIMLGFAVSIDGFGVGFAYGLRRVHIPPFSLLIVCLASAVSIFVSMLAGSWVAGLIGRQAASFIGGIMLIGVGLLIVRQAIRSKWRSRSNAELQEDMGLSSQGLSSQGLSSQGLTLLSDVLQDASRADFDHSGVITGREALVLGVALAIDAFGTGFGAAMIGFGPFAAAVAVGLTKLLLISAGLQLGKHYAKKVKGEKAAVFAGVVLMILGLTHVFG